MGVFKYYDFFATSFANAFLGGKTDGLLLNIILPVGIGFYTFQALSYSKDAFLNKHCAEIYSAKEKDEAIVKKLEEYKKSLKYHAVTGKIEC